MRRRHHRSKNLSRSRRRRGLSGEWADRHQGFPWYGIGWGWHVFLIWPALGWLITAPIRAVAWNRYAERQPAG